MGGRFRVFVVGPFDVVDNAGFSHRPTSRKECGLIALLALTPRHRHNRKWLQDKLWSDRDEDRGAASLRQALVNLRKRFGRDAITTDRTWVALSSDKFEFELAAAERSATDQADLLEGMDVRDEEFESWLRQEREAFRDAAGGKPIPEKDREAPTPGAGVGAEPSPAVSSAALTADRTPAFRLAFETPCVPAQDDRLSVAGHLLVDELLAVAHTLDFGPQMDRRGLSKPLGTAAGAGAADPTFELRVRTSLIPSGAGAAIFISAIDWYGSIVWHRRDEIDRFGGGDLTTQIQRSAHAFALFLLERTRFAAQTSSSRSRAAALTCEVLRGVVLASKPDAVRLATHARAALELHPSALNHALMGTVEVIAYGERLPGVDYDPADTMEHFYRALALAPDNGLVSALCGHAHSFFRRDVGRGLPLTQDAVRRSPSIGLCWLMHALSLTYAGRLKEAVAAAERSSMLNRWTIASPFSDGVLSFTNLMVGKVDEAVLFAEASRERLPNLRATLLNLAVAYALQGRLDEGRVRFDELKSFNPDISLDLLRSPNYPLVNNVHREIVLSGAELLGIT